MEKVKTWLFSSLRNQIFSTMLFLVSLFSFAIWLISWAGTELTADSFINDKLARAMDQQIEQSISQGSIVHVQSQVWQSYLSSDANLPHFLAELNQAGIYELDSFHVHVAVRLSPYTDSGNTWFYLLYYPDADPYMVHYGDQVQNYVLYLVVLVFLIGVIIAYQLARLVSHPILMLQQQVNQASPSQPPSLMVRDDEIGQLSLRFVSAFERLNLFIEREKSLTRYASHELRTPVTVIQGALEVISYAPNLASTKPALQRIEKANQNMAALVTTFLSLGRESIDGSLVSHSLSSCLDECLQHQAHLLKGRKIVLSTDLRSSQHIVISVYAKVIINNLLRNAYSYCNQQVSVQLHGRRLLIWNDLAREPSSGFGHGKQIVADICSKAGWWQFQKQSASYYYWLIYF